MDEVRAALAIARKDLRQLSRYRWAMISMIFIPLYQGVIPAFLFGASFAIGGRVLGLESAIGTDNLSGFIFMGGVVSGLIATTFWLMAMSIRWEMDTGTLEPTWLTPTRHDTLLIGRTVYGLAQFLVGQVILFAAGIAFFGLRFSLDIVYALPALALATIAMLGVAYLLAGIVLLIREANFFIDCTQFLYAVVSGVSFPITFLPLVAQPIALLLPTTYAMDILRQHALGARPLFDPRLEYVGLILTTLIALPVGRWAFAHAERTMRVRGTLGQY
ncbi:MAG TPA: ABC transporter permease [Candidatus Limnocylindria bacterium]|jgi:ABC-2 type transport system permease protein|nr:ABC transporter permease [Candidatus Limnocylindria bacterium]